MIPESLGAAMNGDQPIPDGAILYAQIGPHRVRYVARDGILMRDRFLRRSSRMLYEAIGSVGCIALGKSVSS